MVRQKVRTQSLLLKKKAKKNTHGKEKGKKNRILSPKTIETFQTKIKQTNNGKEKGKNSILTFQKNHMVRKKVRTVFLLFKKKSNGKEKGKNSNLTFQKITW